MTKTLAIVCAVGAAAVVRADVFVQVNFEGSSASTVAPGNPYANTCTFMWTGQLSVWVWGSGADTALRNISFDLGDGVQWQANSVGVIDPLNIFNGFAVKQAGSVKSGPIHQYIDGVLLGVIAGPNIPLPQDSAGALKIYQGFVATNIDVGGLIRAESVMVESNKGVAVVHSSGIVETPAPGTAIVLLGALAGVRRRR